MTAARVLEWGVEAARRAVWAPAGVLAIHAVGMWQFDVYKRAPWFDSPMHLLGGAAIAYLFHTASVLGSERGVLGPWHRGTHALLVFGWTAVAAVMWEFVEFLSDRYLGTRMQGSNLRDTLKDMFLGLAGGAVLLVGLYAAGAIPQAERAASRPAG